MFDIGWTEMLVIAVVMIVVVGPKDLPKMLRTFGKTTAKLRAMAGDFQRQFNEALKEAELDDVKKSVDELRNLNPAAQIKKQINPFEKAAADVRAGIDAALKPSKLPEPAAAVAQAAEPLKNGATAMPDIAGPETMPAPPVMTPLDAAPAPAAVVAATAPAGSAAASTAAPQPAAPADAPAKPAPRKRGAGGTAGKATNGKAASAKSPAKRRAPAKAKPAEDPIPVTAQPAHKSDEGAA
jgi:sec-independent protein translocase protein TatB